MDSVTWSGLSPDEQELRRTRDALCSAVNAQDVEAVRRFLHPEFRARDQHGNWIGLEAMLTAAAALFRSAGQFQETVDVESVELDGETARMATTRTDRFKLFGFLPQSGVTRQEETWVRSGDRWLLREERVR